MVYFSCFNENHNLIKGQLQLGEVQPFYTINKIENK